MIVYPASESRAPQARMLARHGYRVLMLEMRGYGGSDGDPNMFGWGATRDLDAAAAFLAGRPDVRDGRIGGLGFSVGGEQVLEAAAGNLALKAVVSDGAGERSIRESVLHGVRGWLALPTAAVETAAVALLSGDGAAARARRLGRADRPAARLPHLRRSAARAAKSRSRSPTTPARPPRRLLADPRATSHRRLRGSPARVRAPRRRILRPGSGRLTAAVLRLPP